MKKLFSVALISLTTLYSSLALSVDGSYNTDMSNGTWSYDPTSEMYTYTLSTTLNVNTLTTESGYQCVKDNGAWTTTLTRGYIKNSALVPFENDETGSWGLETVGKTTMTADGTTASGAPYTLTLSVDSSSYTQSYGSLFHDGQLVGTCLSPNDWKKTANIIITTTDPKITANDITLPVLKWQTDKNGSSEGIVSTPVSTRGTITPPVNSCTITPDSSSLDFGTFTPQETEVYDSDLKQLTDTMQIHCWAPASGKLTASGNVDSSNTSARDVFGVNGFGVWIGVSSDDSGTYTGIGSGGYTSTSSDISSSLKVAFHLHNYTNKSIPPGAYSGTITLSFMPD